MKHGLSKTIVLGIIAAWQLSAGVVTIASDTNTAGTSALTGLYWGETFLAAASGNNLTFNFFSDSAATTPEATGTLYLLSSEYLGTPSDLSSGTTGYLASVSASGGGVWTFPSVSLSAGTEYWVYVDAVQPTIYGGGAEVANQGAYFSDLLTDPYFALDDTDVNFLATTDTGGSEGTPEPTTLLLMAPALLLVLRRRLTR
jgi:hypothetical protein